MVLRFLAAILVAGSACTLGARAAMADAAAPSDAIMITDSGSTNTNGYRIVVSVSGRARYESGSLHGMRRLPKKLVAKLKYDVMMAQPLEHVRARPDCMKPVSFGTTTTVTLGAEQTADLNCAASPKGEALKSDAEATATYLNLPTPRHPQP
jgi:hypothetical protein